MRNSKQRMAWLWQDAEKVLIVIFFLTFTLNIRKVFLTPFSFLNGGFNEYTTISVSWADLLMLAIIVIYTTKSIVSQVINSYYASPGHGKVFEKSFKNVSRETFFLLLFIGWAGLSISWSQFRPIALYRFLTLAEIAFFAFMAIKSLKNSKWLKIALFAVIIDGLFQSLLGIAQFIHNGSLGIRFLGESIIGPNVDGVAKIIIAGEKHIRAYGTMPHPNILAGFLLIPLFLLLAESISRLKKVSHETLLSYFPDWLLLATIITTGLGFILTFSRSAFLGLFAGLAIYFIWIAFSWHSTKISKANLKFLILMVLVTALAIIILINNTSFFSSQSLEERNLYQNVSHETILSHPVRGIGIGQFVLNEYNRRPNSESWQYQPVHNTYLLIFSELGIIEFILLLLFLISLILNIYRDRRDRESYRLTFISFYCIVFSFLIISFFDHYFWDIKLGTLIFVLPFILYFIVETSRRGVSSVNEKLDKYKSSAIIIE